MKKVWLQEGAPLVDLLGEQAERGQVEVRNMSGVMHWVGIHQGHGIEITTYSALSGSYAVKAQCSCGAVGWVVLGMEKSSDAPAIPIEALDRQLSYVAYWYLAQVLEARGELLQSLVALREGERATLADRWYCELDQAHPPTHGDIREIRGTYQAQLFLLQREYEKPVIEQVMSLLHEIDPIMYKWCSLIEEEITE